jgi:hypothetical protein
MHLVCQALNGFGCRRFGGIESMRRLHLVAEAQRRTACSLHGIADAMGGRVLSCRMRSSAATPRSVGHVKIAGWIGPPDYTGFVTLSAGPSLPSLPSVVPPHWSCSSTGTREDAGTGSWNRSKPRKRRNETETVFSGAAGPSSGGAGLEQRATRIDAYNCTVCLPSRAFCWRMADPGAKASVWHGIAL